MTDMRKECCGVLCDRDKVQRKIDTMQDVINRANAYFQNPYYPAAQFDKLLKDLKKLSDK